MRNSSLVLVALVAVAAALLAASASPSSSSSRSRVLMTRGYIQRIAADGGRVAAATTDLAGCDRIVVWDPAKKAIVKIKTGVSCAGSETPKDAIPTIVLAGKRVAWIELVGGMSNELNLRNRTIGSKKTVTTTSTSFPDGEDTPTFVFDYLAGHGNLIAYDTWIRCLAIPVGWEGGQSCPEQAPGGQPIYKVSDQKLLKIVNGKAVEIASAPDAEANEYRPTSLAVVSVDANRIATQGPDGAVTIYSAAGDVLQTIPVPSGSFAGVALRGSQLIALRDDNLELYDVDNGELVKTFAVEARSRLRDLQGGLAVYTNGRTINVLRLSNEKRLVISPPGNPPAGKKGVDAQIEASGLYYSYNYKRSRNHGRVVFVPRAKLLKKLG